MTAPAAPSRGASRVLKRFPISIAVAYTAISVFPSFLVGAYAVRLQDDLGFGTAELGYTGAALFIAGSAAAAALGPVIDRTGASAGFRIGSVLSAGASLVVALAARNWLGVALGMALCGFANAVSQLAANRLLVRRATDRRQGVGFGLKQASVPTASVLAGFAVSFLGAGVSWRATFLVAAAVAVALAAVVPRSRRSVPRQRQRVHIGADGRSRLLILAAVGGLAGAAGNTLALLIVDALHDGGFTEASAALVLGLGSATSLVVRILAGWVVDRRHSSGFTELSVLLTAGAAGFTVLAVSGNSRAFLLVGTLLAFGAGWAWAGVLYFAASRTPAVPPATATGMVLSGVMLGSVVGPSLIGFIADHAGYGAAWGVGAGLVAAGAVLSRIGAAIATRTSAPGR